MERELALYRFVTDLATQLASVRDADKALKTALRAARDFFSADEAFIAKLPPGGKAEAVIRSPHGALWDRSLLTAFLRGARPRLPHTVLLAPIERRGRTWGALGLRNRSRPFDRTALRDVVRVTGTVSREVQRLDRARIAEVRARIDRKMMEQLRPKDLFYQVLHGLRSLNRYDHSAAVLIHDRTTARLELVAEQIAWRKGKSERIGSLFDVSDDVHDLITSGAVYGFGRSRGEWCEWNGRPAAALAGVLDYNVSDANEAKPRAEQSMLIAPLMTKGEVLGLLKVAACHAQSLGVYEAELVRSFLPQATVAIQNLTRTASLESGLLEAEKKHVMADLARGVSHDVNNAFGSVLPLVQQMLSDARGGRLEADVVAQDLEQIEESLQVCRRIFGGMLSFAKGASHSVGGGNVRRAVESTMAVLEESMRRLGVLVETTLDPELPAVRATQGDLEQLLLNVATNAREAMPGGGLLSIRATQHASGSERAPGGEVLIEVEDTGSGISPDVQKRIREPFFTTKPGGTGLGLSICRSIAWRNEGQFSLESWPQRGTLVRVRLPVDPIPRGETQKENEKA